MRTDVQGLRPSAGSCEDVCCFVGKLHVARALSYKCRYSEQAVTLYALVQVVD